ncbi:MAG: hypothetical protein R3224_08615, partial [Balneolaceae bacterium]|nr:hypothetical protein [Balneolaceae bacterium]
EQPFQQSGNVPYSTLTTIAESPLKFNVIWVGTDDGNVHVTRDGGASWSLVSENLPSRRWVSEVHASAHDPATAYVSLNGYRYDEFKTYIYKTDDYGRSWLPVSGNLPENVVNIIVQDPVVPELLYAGLDNGAYVSFDDGDRWHLLPAVPNTASYDMVVHPRDLELVIATHGRSIYVMDLKPLHTVAERRKDAIVAINTEPVRYSEEWGEREAPYREVVEPNVAWLYWLGNENADAQPVAVEIRKKGEKRILKRLETTGHFGFNTVRWNLLLKQTRSTEDNQRTNATYLGKGEYLLTFKTERDSDEIPFVIQ